MTDVFREPCALRTANRARYVSRTCAERGAHVRALTGEGSEYNPPTPYPLPPSHHEQLPGKARWVG